MKTKFFLTVFLIFILASSYGQKIEIGQSAQKTKQIIEYSTRSRTGYDSYGNSMGNNIVWDVNYFDGEISEVIQCFSRQYLTDLKILADFCKHYIMDKGKLAYVLTQYENISVAKLRESYNQLNSTKKINDLYFTEGYENYSTIYLHSNGLATVKWEKTNLDDLSPSIESAINRKLIETKEVERQKLLAQQRRKEREKEIKSKLYNLQEYAPDKYEQVLNSQRKAIKKYFKNPLAYNGSERFPSFKTLEKSVEKQERFKSIYNVHYKLKNNSKESVDYESVNIAGSQDIETLKNVELVSGIDKNLKLFNSASISLPTIEMEGFEAMSEATLNNIKVDFTRGITEVKIKKGKVEFKKYPPEKDLQTKIVETLTSQPKGRYLIQYEIADIMGETEVTTDIEKIPNKAKKIVKTASSVLITCAIVIIYLETL